MSCTYWKTGRCVDCGALNPNRDTEGNWNKAFCPDCEGLRVRIVKAYATNRIQPVVFKSLQKYLARRNERGASVMREILVGIDREDVAKNFQSRMSKRVKRKFQLE